MKQPLPKSTNSLKSINFNDRISYQERIEHFTNPIAKKLLGVMVRKQSNIAVSADVITKKELLALAEMVGPYICMLKTHIDIVHDFDQDLIDQLNQLAITHDFILFEDRKFADIGNTVQHQYSGGVYQISRWADVINAHLISGPGVIDGLKESSAKKERALLLLAQMSSMGNLITRDYTDKNVQIAQQYSDFVIGFICREKIAGHNFLYCAPGVQLQEGTDGLGQSYLTPEKLIADGIDLLIVGRGVYKAHNPAAAARQYQKAGWEAYEKQLTT